MKAFSRTWPRGSIVTRAYVISESIFPAWFTGSRCTGVDSPCPAREIGNRSVQLTDVFAEGSKAGDPAAEDQEPPADGFAAPDPGAPCDGVRAALHNAEHQRRCDDE